MDTEKLVNELTRIAKSIVASLYSKSKTYAFRGIRNDLVLYFRFEIDSIFDKKLALKTFKEMEDVADDSAELVRRTLEKRGIECGGIYVESVILLKHELGQATATFEIIEVDDLQEVFDVLKQLGYKAE